MMQGKAATPPRDAFDRCAEAPPSYLHTLRGPGGRRYWRYACTWNSVALYSNVLTNAYGNRLPRKRGIYLDAGCGNSPDAILAVKYLKFKSAKKVDLWPTFTGNPYAKGNERRLEGKRVEFIQGDICKLSDYIPLGSVDMIGCNAAIDLMCKGDRCLFYNEALDVLAPGGMLLVSHVKLAHGHNDWVSGREEYEMINPFGLLGVECVVATKSLLAIKKPVEGPDNA